MNAFNTLIKRIARYRRRKKILCFIEQSLQFFCFAGVIFIALPLLYKIGKSDLIFRWLMSLSTGGLFFFFAIRKILQPLISLFVFRKTPAIDQSALEIGEKFSAIKDDLSNAVQLLQDQQNRENPLVLAAFEKIVRRTAAIDFCSRFSLKKIRRMSLAMIAVLFTAVINLTFWYASYEESVAMLLKPGNFPASQALGFSVRPGNLRIPRGESLEIFTEIYGEISAPPVLKTIHPEGAQNEEVMIPSNSPAIFSHKMENINTSFEYYIRSGRKTSDKYFIEVIDLPEVLTLQLFVRAPAYANLKTDTLERNIGDAAVLPGSDIDIAIVANKRITAAKIVFPDSTKKDMPGSGTEFTAQIKISTPLKYNIILQDELGLKNKSPIDYSISLKEDQYPLVKIEVPGKDVDLDESMEIPLQVLGEDDFGFSKLDLFFRILKNTSGDSLGFQKKNLSFKVHEGILLASMFWDLMPLEIYPEDIVEYFVQLYDNDMISGPKKASSKVYRLRLPSIKELFAESDATQDEATSSIEELYEESRELEKQVENVLQNIRRNQQLKWQDEQAIKETLARQKEMLETLDEVKQNLAEMVDKLDKNDLLALETLEKYQELQDLMEKIASPELREMMEKLRQALEKMDPKQMQNSLENFQAMQEEFIQNMEKTINLLKQLEAEQKLDETMKLAELLVKKQREINENLQKTKQPQDLQQSAGEQQQQAEQLETVKKNLQSLQQSAEALPQMQMPGEMLSDIQEQAGQIGREIQNAVEQMQSANQKGAKKSGRQLSQQLQQMQSSLSKMQQQMQQNQKSEVLSALKQSRRNILRLSKRQEKLAGQSAKHDPTQYRDIAKNQQDLLSAMQRTGEQMYRLSEKSFFVPPEISRKFGEAQQKMQSSIDALEKNRGGKAGQEQQNAMQALNGALSELQQAMQSLQGQSGGGSMLDQFLQQMQSMSQQQQGINQGTQQLGMQGQLTPSQQGRLMRLAAQQEALRRALERLQAQKEGGEMLGSLAKIAEEMRQAAKEMRTQKVNRKTIERQERILSRLLDAQKSVRKQQYSKKRHSRSGKEYFAIDPGTLPDLSATKKELLKRDLLRAMRANYSKDYKLLIQKYFEALTKELESK